MAVSTSRTFPAAPTEAQCNGGIPALENGDRLTRAEFERRYEAMPGLKKAELIEGEDDYIEGAPELVAEVASSSASYDLGKKLNAYRRNGVREYVVWRVLDRQVDWFVNRDGRFELMPPSADGILRSTVFPGLWLDPNALVRGEKTRVKAILQQGLDSAEHADFVARLERARIA